MLVDIASRTASLESGLERANKALEHFGEQAREVGEKVKTALEFAGVAVALGEIVHKFDEFVEHAVNVERASQKTGIAVEEFSKLEFAAKNAGVGSEQLASGLEKFAKSADLAAGGSKKQADAFAAIGVTVQDANGHIKPMSELLSEVSDKFAGYKDSAEKTALAQILFGKAGADLIPLLNEGSKGIEDYGKRAQELGIVLDEKTTQAAEGFHKKLIEVHAVGDAFWQLVAGQLLPTLTAVADQFVKGGQGVNKFTSAVEPLITGLKVIIDVGYTVKRTFMDIGDALGALGAMATAPISQFKRIWKDYSEQSKQSEAEANEFLKKLWSEQGDSLVKMGDEAKKAGDGAGKATAPIVTGLKKAFDMAEQLRDTYAEIDKLSRSNFDGAKSVDLGNAAAKSAGAEIDKLHEQFVKAQLAAKDATDQMQVYADQAARNMQTAFANFLFDPFKGGMKGMVVGFIDTVRRMIAEAASANIMETLFGKADNGKGSGLGGVLGGVFSGLSSLMGGANAGAVSSAGEGFGAAADAEISSGFHFASGGRPPLNQASVVGENGPELFIPDSAGTIMPNGGRGGSGSVHYSPTYHIQSGVTRQELMPALEQTHRQSIAEISRLIKGGAFAS